MYLVKSGSLIIVARTPREAIRIRQRIVERCDSIVQVTDLDGFSLDIDKIAAELEKEE